MLFDPGATMYLKYFDLFPRRGGLLNKIISYGLLKTVKNIFDENPLVFWSNIVLALFLTLFYVFALMSIFQLYREKLLESDPKRLVMVLCLLVLIGYFIMISGGPYITHRFRHPAMPLLSIFVGHGIYYALKKNKNTV